jgi:hypothetical protein
MQPYVSVRNADQMAAVYDLHPNALVGLGNEPIYEQNGWTFGSYLAAAETCVDVALEMGLPIYLGELPNLNPQSFRFLERLPWSCSRWSSPLVRSSMHRYPEVSGPETPHRGFSSREREVERWKQLVGPRPLLIGEVGYTNVDFTEAQQAEFMGWEAEFWSGQGVDWLFGYQINDGPGTSHENHYGFRRLDGTWKPCLQTFFATEG